MIERDTYVRQRSKRRIDIREAKGLKERWDRRKIGYMRGRERKRERDS